MNDRHDIPALTALRGVAALAVFIYHLHLFPGGYRAVDVFFVLSGFVIARAYGGAAWPGWGRFMALRAVRLYPLHLAVLSPLLLAGGGNKRDRSHR